MIPHYNFPLQEWEGNFVFGMVVGSCASFFLGVFRPAAGPDWMWAGGRDDVIRNLYFRPNGSFRRYGRAALFLTLLGGSGALALFLPLG
jgi:hypothetical protein